MKLSYRKNIIAVSSADQSHLLRLLSVVLVTVCLMAANPVHALVGVTEGKFEVANGAATYSIPIDVPPGRGGMQPELSINFNSNAGNGYLGVGFSLGGASSITRCGSTIATDGKARGVYLGVNDKYCLDGQRLIRVGHNEYRTEIDSFSKIVAYGNIGGPARWKVWTKSGQIMEYGFTHDSRIEAQGRAVVRAWNINKISDTTVNGNSINYFYCENNNGHCVRKNNGTGEVYLARITYVGGSININYADRKDKVYGYFAGSKLSLTKRITTIVVRSGSTAVRQYNINYADITSDFDKSRINYIQQQNRKNSSSSWESLPKVYFSWENVDKKIVGGTPKKWLGHFGSSRHAGGWHNDHHIRKMADVNGDGLADVVGFGHYGVYVALATGSGFSTPSRWDGGHFGKDEGGWNIDDHIRTMADVNGDGMADAIGFGHLGVDVALSTGSGFGTPFRGVNRNFGYGRGAGGWDKGHHVRTMADVNGDGLADIVGFGSRMVAVALATGSGGFRTPSRWFSGNFVKDAGGWNNKDHVRTMADVNGDGLADIVGFGHLGVNVALSTGRGFTAPSKWRVNGQFGNGSGAGNWDNDDHIRTMADVNGDGLADIVGFDSMGVRVALSTGSGFTTHSLWLRGNFGRHAGGWNNDDHVRTMADINGDGMADVVAFGHNGVGVALSTGNGFGTPFRWLNHFGNRRDAGGWNNDGHIRTIADVNGDGLPDVVGMGHNGVIVYENSFKSPAHKKIKNIKNGKNEIVINYKALHDKSVYSGNKGSYPNLSLRGSPMKVVSKVSSSNGIGGYNVTTYKYANYRINLQGRGSLGFEKIIETDHTTGIVSTTWFRQDFPFIGSPRYAESKLNGKLISRASTDYRNNKHPQYNKVYKPYVYKTVEQSFDLHAIPLKTITTVNSSPDVFNNIRNVRITTTGGGRTFTKTTISQYNNYTNGKWHLGRLKNATVKHEGGVATVIKTSGFTYNAQGLLETETVQPGHHLSKTTRYQYDGYGNKISAVSLASTFISNKKGSVVWGQQSRGTATQYDSSGRFPKTSHIIKSGIKHREIREFDEVCGKPTRLIGPNGLPTIWRYDALCRKIKEVRADGTTTDWTYAWDSSVAHSLYKITEKSSGKPAVTVWFDALQRKLRTQTTAFNGELVNTDIVYNKKGEIVKQSLPYYAGEHIPWVTNSFDALGRTLHASRPDGATTSYSYAGLYITATDPNGNVKITTRNVLDKVIEVNESGSRLRHEYDAIGNLRRTNANGSITTVNYDRLGNKTSMNDPAMGIWSYSYNGFGELIRQKNAKGQLVSQVYDELGRMIKRIDHGGSETNWKYDTAYKGIGKLAKVTGPNNSRTFTYDGLGRQKTVIETIDSKSFISSQTYDAYSRLKTVVMPDGLRYTREYQNNMLRRITMPRSQILDYDYGALEASFFKLLNQISKLKKLEKRHQSYYAYYIAKAKEYERQAKFWRTQAKDLEDERRQILAIARKVRDYGEFHKVMNEYYAASASRRINEFDVIFVKFTGKNPATNEYIYQVQKPQDFAQTFVPIFVGGITSMIPHDYREINPGGSYNLAGLKNKINAADAVYLDQSEINKQKAGYLDRARKLRDLQKKNLVKANDFKKHVIKTKIQDMEEALRELHVAHKANVVNKAAGYVPIFVGGITSMLPVYQKYEYEPNPYYSGVGDIKARLDKVLTEDTLAGYIAKAQAQGVNLNQALAEFVKYYNKTIRQHFSKGDTSGVYGSRKGLGDLLIWAATTRDASGRLAGELAGNGLLTHRIYNPFNGNLEEIRTGVNMNNPLRHLTYTYDNKYNVLSRADYVNGVKENFEYDVFDRLKYADLQSPGFNKTYAYRYDIRGNITHKSDVGTLIYKAGNRLDRIVRNNGSASVYKYDRNGNILTDNNRNIQWNSFNKVARIVNSSGSAMSSFTYGVDRQRVWQRAINNGNREETFYVNKSYEVVNRLDKDGNTLEETKHYIYADKGQAVAIQVRTVKNGRRVPDKFRYLHRDALNSIDTITDSRGKVVERLSFDPFGKRRNINGSVMTAAYTPGLTGRGFTSHEHMDNLGLINMNGRIYDAELGRFLSADPFIQQPSNARNYNRYSYALNNPLKYIDPSGFFLKKLFKKIKRWLPLIISIAAMFFIGTMVVQAFGFPSMGVLKAAGFSAHTAGVMAASGFASGFVTGFITTGNLKGALKEGFLGAIGAVASFGIGHSAFGKSLGRLKHAAHGVTRGAMGSLRGGSFKSGFLSGLVGSIAGGFIEGARFLQKAGPFAQYAATTIAGGAASAAGGGKFANGAVSAAFVYIFNEALTIGGAVRIPGWIQKLFGVEVPVQGFSGGIAISYPAGSKGGKWDAGVYGEVAYGGGDIGIGRANIEVGEYVGSVTDLSGDGAEMSVHYGPAGGSIQLDSDNNIQGHTVNIGYGYNVSSSGTETRVLSVRRDLLGVE